ncbi:MAG: ATP-grasp domain-containing protein [Lachnospiraceae bacterium]|nr:ATP-grasp domain-containing protein [Lachnospiraceae bacterium]
MNLLLTSAGRRGYLVEYFKEALAGGRVYAANSDGRAPAFSAADAHVVTPLIYEENYIPFLIDYCREHEISLLISLFDIDLPILAANKGRFLRAGVRVLVSDPGVIAVCNDKWKTYAFLCDNGFPAPRTFLDPEEASAACREGKLSWPLIVKPRWGMGSLSIFEAEDEEELRVFYKKVKQGIQNSYLKYEAAKDPDACVLIQEKLVGQEYGLDIINDLDGRYRNTIVKMKYAMRSGETDCAVTVENPELAFLGERVSEKLGHIGNLDMDVFRADGKFYVLEMNARFGGGYPFSHMAGVNLPRAIAAWAAGEEADAGWLRAKPGVMSQKDIRLIRLEGSDER